MSECSDGLLDMPLGVDQVGQPGGGFSFSFNLGGRVLPSLPVHQPGVPLAQQTHGQPVKELHGTCLQEQKICFGSY